MRSRIVAILLSVLLFFSALYIVGLPEKGVAVDTTASSEQEQEKEIETVICSFKDISYGSDPKQTFDLILPVDNRRETGLVLFLHGGGWVGGDKSSSKKNFGINTENKKFATASINYRFVELGKVDMYGIINDITAALSAIKELAAGYSININKVVLCGYSAGGHLALLYAYRYKDIAPITPVGVFASAPAVDLSLDKFYKKNALGDEEYMCSLMSKVCGTEFTKENRTDYNQLLQDLSPMYYITSEAVPTVIAHGRNDAIVPVEGSELISKKLSEYSVDNELIIFENSGHSLNDDEETKAYTVTLITERIVTWLELDENEN